MDQVPIPILPGGGPDYPKHSFRAAYAKSVLAESLLAELNQDKKKGEKLDSIPRKTLEDFAPRADGFRDDRICIVGAGVTGLFLAMILKFLGVKEFDIIEASDRVGGRCYTYEFPEDKEHPCPHNYYDIGAMRIPDIPTMKSTLALIKDLGLEAKKVPYILDFPEGGPVPPSMHWYTKGGPDEKPFEKVIREVIAKLGDDFDYEKLMALGTDNFSTRSWLMVKHEWTYEQTLEAEGADTSTGLFDQAFTETICDYSDFQAAKAKPWYRLEGGMSVITDTMRDRLASTTHPRPGAPSIKPILNSPVISMAINDDAENTIKVTRRDGETGKDIAKDYDMVFNTTAMAPLQRMDLQGLNLPKEILTGIRALSYDRATKVAIKFKTRWWKGFYQKPGQFGGVSSSDLPISNVVYPSWDDGDDTAAVLMVSYSWAQDATRMGALVPEYKEGEREPKKDDEIVRVCLENLVKLWSNEENPPSLEFLNEQYITHHAWAWSHDPYTGGAYALFGPGQFSNLYPPFQKLLCGRRLSICGEAVSAHHAWISGALDSAYVSLWQWLADRFHVEWIQRLKASNFGPGKGKDAEELDVTLDLWTVELSEKTGSQ